MMLGLFGMSYYSSPESAAAAAASSSATQSASLVEEQRDPPQLIQSGGGVYQGLAGGSDDEDVCAQPSGGLNEGLVASCKAPQLTERTTASTAILSTAPSSSICSDDDGSEEFVDDDDDEDVEATALPMNDGLVSTSIPPQPLSPHAIVMVDVCGFKVRKRTLGMLAAAFCGIWGGSILAPMKWCKSDTKGTHYLMSFSIGASIVTLSFWLVRYLYNVSRCRSFSKAYETLPSFHLRVMWLAGGTSGLLWSIGNFFSLISVFYLGEGVGYPLVQTSILVSGLWGIFYFKEIEGSERISKWLISSLSTIFGILLLSYEHHEK